MPKPAAAARFLRPRDFRRPVLIPILALLCSAVGPQPALARFASFQEAPAVLTRHIVTIDVDRDGRFVEEEEKEVSIRNEAGRMSVGTMGIVYNSRVSMVEVLLAETLIQGKTFPVPPESIEDKPVASNLPGFDEFEQITIPYTGVQVGASIRLRTRTTRREVAFPGHFSRAYFPGSDMASEGFDLTIRSKRPLQVAVHDPDHVLDIAHTMDGGIDTIRVKLQKPVYYSLVEEQDSSFLPADRGPYIQVSTDTALDVPAAPVAAAYEKVIAAPLPLSFGELAQAFAGDKKPFADRLDGLASSFSKKVRYFGDWRPHNGGYVPRPLAEIASSEYGDCKDMASAVVAILRKAGVRADIAWIHRGSIPPVPLPLATPYAYNHAIVRVVQDGKTYWLDPTNPVSFAHGVPTDLMGRDALVLERGTLRKAHVPFPPPEAGVIRGTGTYAFTSSGNARITGRLELLGQQAAGMAGIGRFLPPETVKFMVLRGISEGRRVISGTVGPFDMVSPVVHDISIDFTTEIEGVAIRTTAGLAYRLEHPAMRAFSIIDPGKDQGDYFLGPPRVTESVDRIAGSRLVGNNPGPCRVTSPWVDASWEARQNGRDLLVSSRVTMKKPVLRHADVGGEAFADLQKGVRECFGDYALVFETETGP
jgi:transglutaminase-like putative cysteine protease